MQKFWAKICILIFSGILIFSLIPAKPIFASDVTESFNVTKYLKADGQNQKYINSTNPIAAFIVDVINFILKIISAITVLIIVISGFWLITARGDTNQVQRGKEILINSILGLVVVLSAYLIILFIQSLIYSSSGFINLTPVAFADGVEVKLLEELNGNDTITGNTPTDLLKNYIGIMYKWAASIVGIIAVLNMVISGFQIITTQGGDVGDAYKRIFQSIGGLVILFLSALLLYVINPNFFKIT